MAWAYFGLVVCPDGVIRHGYTEMDLDKTIGFSVQCGRHWVHGTRVAFQTDWIFVPKDDDPNKGLVLSVEYKLDEAHPRPL